MKRILAGSIARGVSLTIITRISALGLGFAQALVMANLLGPQGYGEVAAVISIVAVASAFGLLGVNTLAVREVARNSHNPKATRGFMKWSFSIVLVGGTCAGFGAAMLVMTTAPNLWILAFLLAPLLCLLQLFRGLSLGLGRVFQSQAPLDLFKPLLVITGLVIIFFGGGLEASAGIALILVVLAHAIALVFAVQSSLERREGSAQDESSPSRWIREATPFYLTGILVAFQTDMMTVMLALFSTPEETAFFQIAFRLSTLVLIVRHAVEVALSPRFARVWDTGNLYELQRLACLGAAASTLIGVFILTILIVTSQTLLQFFGDEFAPAQMSLMILAMSQMIFVAAGPLGALLNMTGNAKRATFSLAAAQVTQLPLGLLLIPSMGNFGAALSMSAALLVWTAIMTLAVRRHIGIKVSPLRGFAYFARRGLR